MKNKSTVLAVLAVLGVSFVFAGCVVHPRHRAHWPHPHHRHHLQAPVDSLSPVQRQGNATMLSARMPENLRYPI